ncbi:MAG: putative F420-dependent oxidoreductase [Alphaproteobacteria bacterium]|jgi:probable F420-dependent oxidoreductase
MRIGYGVPNNQGVEDPNDLVALAVKAEELGFSSVWVAEHLFHSSYVAKRLGDRPYHDALTILTAVACATKMVRLGTSVLVLPWHDPARLGKMVATIDHLSKGRVDLGVGVATTKDEFENLGVDFSTRGRRTDEILAALRALWTEDIPKYEGEFYQYEGLKFSPKPFQKPYPPLLIGGASAAARRRVAQTGDGWHTLRQSPDQIAAGREDIIERTEAVGRDPSRFKYSISIQIRFSEESPEDAVQDRTSLSGSPDDIAETIKAYEAAGLTEIVLGAGTADIDQNITMMTRFMNEVQPKL